MMQYRAHTRAWGPSSQDLGTEAEGRRRQRARPLRLQHLDIAHESVPVAQLSASPATIAATVDNIEATISGDLWPQEMLSDDLPNANILVYGYNADVSTGISKAILRIAYLNMLEIFRYDLIERSCCKRWI